MATFRIIVGRLMWDEVRDYLRKQQFLGRRFDWMESSGITEKEFLIKGNSSEIYPLFRDMKTITE